MTAVLIVAVIVALLGLAGIVALLATSNGSDSAADDVAPTAPSPSPTAAPPTSDETGGGGSSDGTVGYATPKDALLAQLPQDWTYKKAVEGRDEVTYWAGPPQSEWATVYMITRTQGAGWRVTEAYPFGSLGEGQGSQSSAADQAVAVVGQ